MNLENFKTQYQQALQQSLDQLQTAVLLLEKLKAEMPEALPSQLEAKILNIGKDLQNISGSVEEFITQKAKQM